LVGRHPVGYPKPMRRRTVRVTIAVLLLVVSWTLHAQDVEAVTVAVAYFDNTSGVTALDPLKKGLADMLVSDLTGTPLVRMVERERLDAVLTEVALQRSSWVDSSSAVRLGKGLGAAYIVTGAYLVQGDTIRVDARVIDVETGEIAAATHAEGLAGDVLTLERTLAGALAERLGGPVPLALQKRMGRRGTRSLDALNAYSQGLDALDRGDTTGAADAARRALAKDPAFVAADEMRQRVEALAVVYLDTESEQIASRLADYRVGDSCACAWSVPFVEAEKLPPARRLGARWAWMDIPGTTLMQLQAGAATMQRLRHVGDLIRAARYEDAEAELAVWLDPEFLASPLATGMVRVGRADAPPVPRAKVTKMDDTGLAGVSLSARAYAMQLRAYIDLQQLELDSAMEWAVRARALPEFLGKDAILGGTVWPGLLGLRVDEAIDAQIRRAASDPVELKRRRAALQAATAAGARTWARASELAATRTCADACPWSEDLTK
jgi:TolB-like protein